MARDRARHAWRQTVTTLGRWKAAEVDEPVLSMEDLRWLWRVSCRAWGRLVLRVAGGPRRAGGQARG